MKVYCVFYFNGLEDILDKVFVREEKAKWYIQKMLNSTEFGWTCVVRELEE